MEIQRVYVRIPPCNPIVSIPNGMEFYRRFIGGNGRARSVSIPNGMEFYCIVLAFLFFYNLVSIPNGMEFY